MRIYKVFLAFFVLLLASCGGDSSLTRVRMPGGELLKLETADTPEQRARGLMNRKELCDDCGMLFVFDSPRTATFWMKDTLMALDLVFLNEKAQVTEVMTMRPCKLELCPGYSSKEKVLYALELNAGKAERLGLEKGDILDLNGTYE